MIGNDGTFTGYAYVFGVVAKGHNEMIVPGAFTATIDQWKAKAESGGANVPVLRNHNDAQPIGVIEDMLQDDKGLWVRGKLVLGTDDADEVQKLSDAGALGGMSIGFVANKTEKIGDITHLSEVDLHEVSFVVFPAIETAMVDGMINLYDAMVLDEKSVRRTNDGYLTCMARVARTGIQEYKGVELGRPDMPTVRVYRPEGEVFGDAACRSFAYRPVTYNHPRMPVNAGNWKKLAVGQTGGDVVRDGQYVRVPLVLMDGDTIALVESGEAKELSMGYSTDLKWEAGVTADGKPYDAIQTAIRGNHLAVVAAARGGSELRIGDAVQTGEVEMVDRTIVVDGVNLTLSDVSAAVVSRALEGIQFKAKDLQEKLTAAEEEKKKVTKDAADAAVAHKTALDAKDGEITVLKQKVADAAITPEKLSALVTDRQAVCDKAIAILGDKYVFDGKTNDAIRKDVVTGKLGDAAKDMSDAAIAGAFSALTNDVKVVADGVNRTARAFSAPSTSHNAMDSREKAYEAGSAYLKDAWKTPGKVKKDKHV
jgi:HK97 family phage prohead protease